jgi:hypothetical protein
MGMSTAYVFMLMTREDVHSSLPLLLNTSAFLSRRLVPTPVHLEPTKYNHDPPWHRVYLLPSQLLALDADM